MVNVKTWATEEKRKANGFTSIESFMTKRRGRPKKRISLEMAQASGKAATVANQNRPSAKRRKKVITEADLHKATTVSAVAERREAVQTGRNVKMQRYLQKLLVIGLKKKETQLTQMERRLR